MARLFFVCIFCDPLGEYDPLGDKPRYEFFGMWGILREGKTRAEKISHGKGLDVIPYDVSASES